MEKDLSELLTHCIRCGFCLESCPTFVTTASELESPRGRIYLIRSAEAGQLDWKNDVKPHIDLCLGCRACETACPSGVEYGTILEMARDKIEEEDPDFAKNALLASTTNPGILKTQLTLSRLLPGKRLPGVLSSLISGQKAEADLPVAQGATDFPPLDESKLPPVKGEVYFLEGCAMRVLYGRVNLASKRLLRRAGYRIREVNQDCCGALHAHNGHLGDAAKYAGKLMERMMDPIPVVVNSAGCGSTMKDYKNLANGEPGSQEFSKRVFDLSEFLYNEGLAEQLAKSKGIDASVAYHEACHLVHGQKISLQPKALLAAVPGVTLANLPEADMCCGSAGIYNIVQPKMAREFLDRKWDNVESSHPDLVVTANPGCHSWIAQAGREHGGKIPVLHVAELLEASFIGLEHFR